MDNDTQFQSFFQRLDYMSTKSCVRYIPCQTPCIWILLNWQVVSTAGFLDALCSYVAGKHDAKSCMLMVSNIVEERHLAVFYKGLQQVAETIGIISSLERLQLIRCWTDHDFINNLRYCDCKKGCKGFPYDEQTNFVKLDFCVEAIVLQHVCQLTEFCSYPGSGLTANPPITSSNIEEFAKALQDHPFLTSFEFFSEPDQKALQKALLSIPKLTKVTTRLSCFAAETVGEFVAKDTMRELSLDEVNVTTTRQWTALCSALGRKSAKLTLFQLSFSLDKLPPNGELYTELSKALLTNESLETLGVIWHTCDVLLPPHGAALAQALANHPLLKDLHLFVSYDLPLDNYHVWQELFCNGIAQMKSLQRLRLDGFCSWTAPMVQALQQLVPALSDLTIAVIQTVEDWYEVTSCVIYYGKRLTTVHIPWYWYYLTKVQKHEDLLAGALVMNKAGRAYVLDDGMNKRKALVALTSVKDHLDCLYIHLRESPCF